MILLAEKTMTLTQSKEQVFSYVTNMENYGEWFPGVVSIESSNGLPHGVIGKKYKESLLMPEGEVSLVIEVKDCLLNRRFYTEGSLNPVLPAMLMEFELTELGETKFFLRYFSRNAELNSNADLIKMLQQNLSERVDLAEKTLKSVLNWYYI